MKKTAEPLIDITRKHALCFAWFLVLYEFLTYIANDMIMPGMLSVTKTFHASSSIVAYSLTLYILGGASLQIFLGPISDRYGRRVVMLTGAVLFLVCTCLLACSQSLPQFLWGRFLEGMGLCFIAVVGYAVLQEIFEENDAIRLIAVMANVAILAPLLGPLAGALVVHYYNWRWIFVVIAIGALIALWGLWRYMPESVGVLQRTGAKIEPAKLSFREVGKNYLSLLKHPSFVLGSFAYGLLGVPCVAWIALSPVLLVSRAKISLIAYGYWQIPVFSAFIIGNFVLTRCSYKMKLEQLIRRGAWMVFLGLASMAVGSYYWPQTFIAFMPGLIFYCFGYSFVATPFNRWILFSNPMSKGTVSAFMSLVNMGMQALGIALINSYDPTHSFVMFAYYSAGVGILYGLFMWILGRVENSSSEDLRPATCSRDP